MTLAEQFRRKGYEEAKKEIVALAEQFHRKGYEEAKQEYMTLVEESKQRYQTSQADRAATTYCVSK